MSEYVIHYFSGTGNTYHLVKNIESELIKRGKQVEVLNIEKNKYKEYFKQAIHIFCFPVYGFGAPSIVLKYISNIYSRTENKAAIICTSAGIEGQSLKHTKHILNKNGFKVFFTDMVTYTYNFTQILNPQTKETEECVFKEAEERTLEITNKIISNEIYFRKTKVVSKILYWSMFIFFYNIGRRVLGKTFIADDKCINCGICKDACPVNAIKMYEGKPNWGSNCESCQRCINICPKKSIQLSIIKLAIFLISELLPILGIIYINKYIFLPLILNILLYGVMFLLNTIIASGLISILEKTQIFKKLLSLSYTKHYRRNLAKGFNVK